MKKLIALLVLLAAGAGAYWFFALRATGTPPGLVGTLSVEHTAGAAGFQRLDSVASQALEGLKPVAGDSPKLKPLLTAEGRKALLGFDPTTAAGWSEVGVDAALGLTVTFDARLICEPNPGVAVLVGLSDRNKLLKAIGDRLGQKLELTRGDGFDTLALPGGMTLRVGTRGAHTALTVCNKDAAGFKAFLADSGAALADNEGFKTGFREAKGGPTFFSYLNVAGLAGLTEHWHAPPEVKQIIAHEAKLFPGVAMYLLDEGAGFRVVASNEGVEALELIFKPRKGPPKFSKYIPKSGWWASRMSGNIRGAFDGIGKLIPPEMAQAKAGLTSAETMMGMMLGFSLNDIDAAFTGHLLVAGDLTGMGIGGEFVVMAGVNDGTKADALVEKIVQTVTGGGGLAAALGGQEGPKLETVDVAGRKGRQFAMGPLKIVIVRDDEVMLAGHPKAVAAALKATGGENLSGSKAAAALDDEVVYGFAVDLSPMFKLLAASPETKKYLDSPALAGLKNAPSIAGSLRLDRHGLFTQQDAGDIQSIATLTGALAAIAIPAFTKYVNRSKSVEAKMNLRKLEDASMAAFHEERVDLNGAILLGQFPPAAPLTPATSGCPAEVMIPKASDWAQPGWKALNFELRSPHRYRYEYLSDGHSFTARAIGDLDCDGITSTFERSASINEQGEVVRGRPRTIRELE